MRNYYYNGQYYTIKELSQMCGVKYTTLCERFKRGYSVAEAIADETRVPNSIIYFDNDSDYHDWEGLSSYELYRVYWKYCDKYDYTPESNVHFIRCIKKLHPNIRVVPTRVKANGGVLYKRIIRADAYT